MIRRTADSETGSRRKTVLLGFTLLEILVALSLLFTGCLFIFKMFHMAIYSSGNISDEAIAIVLAKKRMEEIRAWAHRRSTGILFNFNTGDWDALRNKVETDPLHPDFRIRISNELKPLRSPSSTTVPNITLAASTRIVKVEVSWDSAAGHKSVELVTLIAEPYRKLKELVVTSAPQADGTVLYTCKGYDDDHNIIEDCFHWHVNPYTGNGTVSAIGAGSEATFTQTTAGNCGVYAVGEGGVSTLSGATNLGKDSNVDIEIVGGGGSVGGPK